MVEVTVLDGEADLEEPILIDGLPGAGLAGKIATDHVVSELEMVHYADVSGEDLPAAAVFEADDPAVKAPVRLFADAENDLLALRSDVPVSALDAPGFAASLTDWLAERDARPVYLSGFPANREPDTVPEVVGVAVGDGQQLLAEANIEAPGRRGLVSGPGGALLSMAREQDLPAAGLIVETDPRFPDPQGARALIEGGIAPIAGVEVDTSPLVERAEEIMGQREQLAERMREAADHESSQARSLGMYR
jgi:uncharacterized protein